MSAKLIEGRRPILGLKQIEVIVSAPGDGKGNWYAANIVSPKELALVPEQQGNEVLNPIFRKALYLTDIAGIEYPARKPQRSFMLYDDGGNGDVAAMMVSIPIRYPTPQDQHWPVRGSVAG